MELWKGLYYNVMFIILLFEQNAGYLKRNPRSPKNMITNNCIKNVMQGISLLEGLVVEPLS